VASLQRTVCIQRDDMTVLLPEKHEGLEEFPRIQHTIPLLSMEYMD